MPTDPREALRAWFLGPRAENASVWTEMFEHIFTDYVHWRRNYFPSDPWIVGRLKRRSRPRAWETLCPDILRRIYSRSLSSCSLSASKIRSLSSQRSCLC